MIDFEFVDVEGDIDTGIHRVKKESGVLEEGTKNIFFIYFFKLC